jgi:glycosyltransferase involved in cell wall biosynthesis
MRAMTVYVHPSESEACPMAVLEASASGLPVVATDVGGTRELVAHGVTGLLIEPRHPYQIAEAVIRLLDRPDAARSMGMAGAERMRRLFSLDACVAAHARLYTEVLGKGAASRVPIGVRTVPRTSSVGTPCLRA